jgi:hypothetical protein
MVGDALRRKAAERLASMDRRAAAIEDDRKRLATAEASWKRAREGLIWQDRVLYGLFGDHAAGREYRRLSSTKRRLERSIKAAESLWERDAAAVDRLLAPVLGALDPEYAEIEHALQPLDVAIRAAATMSGLLARAQRDMRSLRAATASDRASQRFDRSLRAVLDAAPDYERRMPGSELPWTDLATGFATSLSSRSGRRAALQRCEKNLRTCATSVRRATDSLRTERDRLDRMRRTRLRAGHHFLREPGTRA